MSYGLYLIRVLILLECADRYGDLYKCTAQTDGFKLSHSPLAPQLSILVVSAWLMSNDIG